MFGFKSNKVPPAKPRYQFPKPEGPFRADMSYAEASIVVGYELNSEVDIYNLLYTQIQELREKVTSLEAKEQK